MKNNPRKKDIGDEPFSSAEKYQLIFEKAPLGILHFDNKGVITACNSVFLEIIGSSKKALLGFNMLKLPNKQVVQAVHEVLKGHTSSYEGDYESVTANKKTSIKVLFTPVLNENNKVDGGIGIIEDNSERTKAEKKLRENEEKFRYITNNISDVVFTLDKDLNTTYVSPSIEQLTGISPEDHLKKSLEEKHPPGSLKKIRNAIEEAMQRYDTSHPDRDKSEIIELEHYTANGDTIHISTNISFIRDENLNISGFIGISRDITEHKVMEEKLAYQLRFQEMVSRISSTFVRSDHTNIDENINEMLRDVGLFFNVDRTYFFTISEDHRIISNTHEWCAEGIFPGKDLTQNIELDRLPWLKDRVIHNKTVHIPDIDQLPVEAEAEKEEFKKQHIQSLLLVPIFSREKMHGFFGFDMVRSKKSWDEGEINFLQVIANILADALFKVEAENALIKAKQKAEENDRLKSAFLANVSHEIRTPMNGILGFLELLKNPDLESEEKQNYIDIVNQSGKRLMNTINDIIEIARIETGQLETLQEEVNITELMGYHYYYFKPMMDKKGLDFNMVIPPSDDDIMIYTDRHKVDSILHNLLSNSIKFTPEGSVEFGYQRHDDMLVFYVSDTGIGIPHHITDAIFDRFVQADLKLSRPHEGSGLGLSIVKAYVEELGGTVSVQSEPDRGSTFYASIPFISNKEKPAEKPETTMHTEENAKSAKEGAPVVLIAEDEDVSYTFLETLLENEPVTLQRTKTGEEAIEVLRNNPEIILVLMDLKMPGMDGLQATREIRKFNQDIPVIAQTAHALTGDRERAIEAGCNDYISKPINRKHFLQIIHHYTEKPTDQS
ncbi:MAG: PAS domain S-box protein [Bacteroidales bacterium]